MYPLDTMTKECSAAIKVITVAGSSTSGSDWSAEYMVRKATRLRYKDGVGDPKGFISFLKEIPLPLGILPRGIVSMNYSMHVLCCMNIEKNC